MMSDMDIQALVDGQLDKAGRDRVRRLIEQDAQAAQRYEDLMKQKYMLSRWWTEKQRH